MKNPRTRTEPPRAHRAPPDDSSIRPGSITTTLYRCRTPTNWLCPCGRVERELRRAGVEHHTIRTPQRRARRTAVLALTGQHRVPVLAEPDGPPIVDARRIVEHLRRRAAVLPPA